MGKIMGTARDATNPSSDAPLGTLNSSSLRSPATYCSSTLLRSYNYHLSFGLVDIRLGASYLEPICDFLVDLRDALDAVRQRLDGLTRLEARLKGKGKSIVSPNGSGIHEIEEGIPASLGTQTAKGHPWLP